MAETDVTYSIDGVSFASLGVYVSSSGGLVCKPAIKAPLSDDRSWMHGVVYDLSALCFQDAVIQLQCFMEACGYTDFVTRAMAFFNAIADAPNTHTLTVSYGGTTKTYTVMCKDGLIIDKQWRAQGFVGTFRLSLTIPHPSTLTPTSLGSDTVPSSDVSYSIDGNNFRKYGVWVSSSSGLVSRPAIKSPLTYSWGNSNGTDYFADGVRYKEREITLQCFIEASTYIGLINNALAFFGLFAQNGTRRLRVVAGEKVLPYEVFCKDEIALAPEWSAQGRCVGTFTLKLIEPEPVKRVLTGGGQIVIASKHPVNIYWGNGSHSFDVGGNGAEVTVTGGGNDETIITGEPNEFTTFRSTLSTIWSRLV